MSELIERLLGEAELYDSSDRKVSALLREASNEIAALKSRIEIPTPTHRTACDYPDCGCDFDAVCAAAPALRKAAAHRTAGETIWGGVQIKPLEWREHPSAGKWHAERYTIRIDRGEPDFYIVSGWEAGTNPYDTLEAAKAAAQANFEVRIRSALAPPPVDDAELLELAEIEVKKLLAPPPVEPASGIADAVLSWMVRHDLLDAGNEYRAEDVVAVLNDLAPTVEPVLGVTEAAQALVDFAWSAVVTDCTESAEYLNELVDNLRAALAAAPEGSGGDAP